MNIDDQEWMAYIEGEVSFFCGEADWGHQIRRKWSVREKPVSESPIGDYEWKIIPGGKGRQPDLPFSDFDGIYYLLSLDKTNNKFIFQHDTFHCGMGGPKMYRTTYTEINYEIYLLIGSQNQLQERHSHPPDGWLRDHLIALVTQFGPNHFSIT